MPGCWDFNKGMVLFASTTPFHCLYELDSLFNEGVTVGSCKIN